MKTPNEIWANAPRRRFWLRWRDVVLTFFLRSKVARWIDRQI